MAVTTLAVIGTVATVASAGYGIAANSKAAKDRKAAMAQAQGSGVFDPMAIPEPTKLEVPSAPEILSSWRGEVTSKFPEYDKIAGMENQSSQAAARTANLQANPDYYTALNQLTNNALAAGKGRLPDDVKESILRNTNDNAYLQGFSYGKSGGGGNVYAGGNDAAANLALRNLGVSSLDMMKYGDSLSQGVLEQSRASRGDIVSAKDVLPTQGFFQDQMNAAAIAEYNFGTDQSMFKAGVANAPRQAGYNQLLFQTGMGGQQMQSNAANAQLAMSALQALGGLYGTYAQGNTNLGASTSRPTWGTARAGSGEAFYTSGPYSGSVIPRAESVSSAPTLRAI